MGKDINKVLKAVVPSKKFYVGQTTKRKKWKTFGGKVGSTWAGSSSGKYYKRRYHKASRRAWKNEINGFRRTKSLSDANSWVKWKGW